MKIENYTENRIFWVLFSKFSIMYYLLISFITLEIYFTDWTVNWRIVYVVGCLMAYILSSFFSKKIMLRFEEFKKRVSNGK